MTQTPRLAGFATISILLVATFCYSPGLAGGFAFDDYPNILGNAAVTNGDMSIASLAQVAWSGSAGPFKRPIPMVSFALNFRSTGASPFAFKLTNLVIHLINGLLVLLLARLILLARAGSKGISSRDATACALVVSAIWLLHPLNLTSVLYVVQRMNSLAAGFSLLALIFYCCGRLRLIEGRGRGNLLLYLGFSVFTVLGALCKENAVLTIPLAGAIELCFFGFCTKDLQDRKWLLMFFGVALFVPVALGVSYLLFNPEWLIDRFAGRDFTVLERVLTESRVIWLYLSLLFLPRIGRMGLHHDDYALSVGFFEPIVTIFAVTSIVVMLVAAVFSIRRFPMFTFAVLWFAVGHALESTVFPLELIHEHRNYLPSIGPILAGAVGVIELSRVSQIRRLSSWLAFGCCLMLGTLTYLRASEWSDPVTLASIEAERSPRSFRAVYELGRVRYGMYLMSQNEHDYRASVAVLERSLTLDPTAKRPLVELMRVAYIHGDEPKVERKQELIRRYAKTLFHETEWVALHDMVNCRAATGCIFPPGTVFEVLTAALSNPTVSLHVRAQLMVDLGTFYVNQARDYAPAIALLDDALAIRPREFRFHEVRTKILILSGHLEMAENAIAKIAEIDRWDDYFVTPVGRVAELERLLGDVQSPLSTTLTD